jgi:hypothetical protein
MDRMTQNLMDEAARVHKANAKWWLDITKAPVCTYCHDVPGSGNCIASAGHDFVLPPLERNIGELIMLCVSEVSEALEGHRKNLPDDKLPHRSMLEVELADTIIRLLDIAGGFKLNIERYYALDVQWSSNTAENLLQVVKLLTKTYDEHRNDTMFGAYISTTIRAIEQMSEHLALDIWAAYEEKMAYNAQREDHKIEHRLSAHGKKY